VEIKHISFKDDPFIYLNIIEYFKKIQHVD